MYLQPRHMKRSIGKPVILIQNDKLKLTQEEDNVLDKLIIDLLFLQLVTPGYCTEGLRLVLGYIYMEWREVIPLIKELLLYAV